MKEQWQGFKGSKWKDEVDVRDLFKTTTNLIMEMKAF